MGGNVVWERVNIKLVRPANRRFEISIFVVQWKIMAKLGLNGLQIHCLRGAEIFNKSSQTIGDKPLVTAALKRGGANVENTKKYVRSNYWRYYRFQV